MVFSLIGLSVRLFLQHHYKRPYYLLKSIRNCIIIKAGGSSTVRKRPFYLFFIPSSCGLFLIINLISLCATHFFCLPLRQSTIELIFFMSTLTTCYYRRFRLGLCTHSDGKSDENQQSCSCFVDVCFLLGSLYGRPFTICATDAPRV